MKGNYDPWAVLLFAFGGTLLLFAFEVFHHTFGTQTSYNIVWLMLWILVVFVAFVFVGAGLYLIIRSANTRDLSK